MHELKGYILENADVILFVTQYTFISHVMQIEYNCNLIQSFKKMNMNLD